MLAADCGRRATAMTRGSTEYTHTWGETAEAGSVVSRWGMTIIQDPAAPALGCG